MLPVAWRAGGRVTATGDSHSVVRLFGGSLTPVSRSIGSWYSVLSAPYEKVVTILVWHGAPCRRQVAGGDLAESMRPISRVAEALAPESEKRETLDGAVLCWLWLYCIQLTFQDFPLG